MTTAVAVTLAFLPIYLLIRHPFRRIPLHIDTGFYVSNNTIATGRFQYSKGWNAHFAGCSKALPELFYSLVYLIHCRGARSPGETYKSLSRLWVSLSNYVTAIAVGLLSMTLAGDGPTYYYAGFFVFAFLSSEAHYGVYHECAETFQVLCDVAAVLLLLYALQSASPLLMAAAACVYLCGAFYTKLSSGLGFPVLFATAAAQSPAWIIPICAGAAIATASYAAWIIWNRRSPMSLLASIRGHEKSFNQRVGGRGLIHRLTEKARTAANAARNQPIILALAVIGLLFAPPTSAVFWCYGLAVVAVYTAQATDCRYYLIPTLPPLAIVAAFGVVLISQWGPIGFVILALLTILWIAHNPIRAARLNVQALNLWTWTRSLPALQVERNMQLEGAAETIRPLVVGQAVLVYGPCNQAYVLLGASYPTSIVAPEYYLDHVHPDWQRELSVQLVQQPPQWILDTNRCFDAKVARGRLGLDYRMERAFAGDFRLHKLTEVRSPSANQSTERKRADRSEPRPEGSGVEREMVAVSSTRCEDACTFGPQSMEKRESEVQLSGSALMSDSSLGAADDPTAAALRWRLRSLVAQGKHRIAIYGAGRFTIRHADVYRESSLTVVCIIDDNPGPAGANFLDWPVRAPDDVDPTTLDAIIISTDRFTAPILARIRRLWGDQVPAYTADSSEPRASARADARV